MEKYFGKDKVIAADLRYGNWVEFRGQKFQVNDIRGASGLMYVLPVDGIESPGRRPCHEFDPICLTAEILTDKFGFKYNDWYYYKDSLRLGGQREFGKGFSFTAEIVKTYTIIGNDSSSDPITEINKLYNSIIYVHQLQNLYYALTGEELEWKR